MTSPDGITWTIRTSAADNSWNGVTYGNGLFVAVAGTGTGNRVMTSPDGITWTIRTSAADNWWQGVTYGNGLFVAVAGAGTGTGNRVMTSGKTDYIPFSANNLYQGGMNIFGNVGIGTTSPGAQLDLSSDSARKLTTNTWSTGSDSRIKTDIRSIEDGLGIIRQMRPVKYRYNADFLAAHPSVKDVEYYNFIAQEYQKVFPNSVTETDGLLYLNNANMIPYAIAGIQELDERTKGIGLSGQGDVIINHGNVGIGTTSPNARLHVSGGDAALTTQGNGLILRATDGANCYRVTVNNAGILTTTLVTCP